MKDAYTPEEIREMQKRIKALEEALKNTIAVMSSFGGIEAWVNDNKLKVTFQAKYYPAIEKAEQLLNSKP